MQSAEVKIQVQFYDTDSLGIIYYGSYYRFFEVGFLKLLKTIGLAFRDLENKGIYLPAVHSSCDYYAPSRAEETLKIKTSVKTLGKVSITFSHEVRNINQGNKLVALGETKHACVNKEWQVVAIPRMLADKLGTV